MAGCVNKLRCPGFQPSVHSLLPSPSPGCSWKSSYLISLSRSHLINFCQELCLETKRKGSNENGFQTNKENVNSVATLKLSRSGKASLGPPQRESRSNGEAERQEQILLLGSVTVHPCLVVPKGRGGSVPEGGISSWHTEWLITGCHLQVRSAPCRGGKRTVPQLPSCPLISTSSAKPALPYKCARRKEGQGCGDARSSFS